MGLDMGFEFGSWAKRVNGYKGLGIGMRREGGILNNNANNNTNNNCINKSN